MPWKSHKTHDCFKFNPDSTPIKRNGGTGSAQRNGHTDRNCSNQRECKGANFAQIICKEVKKAFHKQSHKCKKCHANDSEKDIDPTTVHEAMGWIAQGNYICVRNINKMYQSMNRLTLVRIKLSNKIK